MAYGHLRKKDIVDLYRARGLHIGKVTIAQLEKDDPDPKGAMRRSGSSWRDSWLSPRLASPASRESSLCSLSADLRWMELELRLKEMEDCGKEQEEHEKQ